MIDIPIPTEFGRDERIDAALWNYAFGDPGQHARAEAWFMQPCKAPVWFLYEHLMALIHSGYPVKFMDADQEQIVLQAALRIVIQRYRAVDFADRCSQTYVGSEVDWLEANLIQPIEGGEGE